MADRSASRYFMLKIQKSSSELVSDSSSSKSSSSQSSSSSNATIVIDPGDYGKLGNK